MTDSSVASPRRPSGPPTPKEPGPAPARPRSERRIITPEGVPLAFQLAERGERAAAVLIDLVIMMLAIALIALAIVFLFGRLGVVEVGFGGSDMCDLAVEFLAADGDFFIDIERKGGVGLTGHFGVSFDQRFDTARRSETVGRVNDARYARPEGRRGCRFFLERQRRKKLGGPPIVEADGRFRHPRFMANGVYSPRSDF